MQYFIFGMLTAGAVIVATELFLEYGMDELSVGPSKVLELREKVRKI